MKILRIYNTKTKKDRVRIIKYVYAYKIYFKWNRWIIRK